MDLSPARVVVVGGGVSGLAAAWRLKLKAPNLEVHVVEGSTRCGGKLISESRDGFVVEGAADGFLARKPPALEWAYALGLGDTLREPNPDHRSSQVLWNQELHPLPEGFSGLVPADPEGLRRSTLLTPEGADRAALERTIEARAPEGEESIASFFSRRYGVEAFERLMEPLLAGIYAGDAQQLSVQAAFPQLAQIEARGLSLTEGLKQTPRTEGPAFRSLAGGMAGLPRALEGALKRLGVEVHTSFVTNALTREGRALTVRGPYDLKADAVILALPPRNAGTLLERLNPDLGQILQSWPTTSVANLNLAFVEQDLPHLPQGSGFVVPRAEGTLFSAVTWSSRKWADRAPKGHVLVRFYFGGARNPDGWKAPEKAMVQHALGFLARFAGGRAPAPLWHRVFRWKDGFAQLNLGHADRHAALHRARVAGLSLAGGYFQGVGIPDCLARSESAAQEIMAYLLSENQGDVS